MKSRIAIVLLFLCLSTVFGQKIKTASGDISILAGEKELSVTFSYDNIMVHGFSSEEEFVEEKVKLREEHKPGLGEQFRRSWYSDRDSVYEPMFIKEFNAALPKKRKVNLLRNNPRAKYNLHVETLWVYPGYNVGFSQPSKIEVKMWLYEKSNPGKIIWESKSPIRIEARTAPRERELRIGAAYSSLAYSMSWLMKKKAK